MADEEHQEARANQIGSVADLENGKLLVQTIVPSQCSPNGQPMIVTTRMDPTEALVFLHQYQAELSKLLS